MPASNVTCKYILLVNGVILRLKCHVTMSGVTIISMKNVLISSVSVRFNFFSKSVRCMCVVEMLVAIFRYKYLR